MPPNTARRVCSRIAISARRVRTKAAVAVAGVAGLMTQRIRAECFTKLEPQAGVRCFDQDWTDEDAAIRYDAAMITKQLMYVEALHHVRTDALVGLVTTAALHLRAQTQHRQHL